ncbi:hypothetical protein Noda2021_06180 [Candidatus Dependentiae bacterium Noda2021]|nr:hypothetical protein Noda2021_06180 [Candidatus Dependentiae bacterium Noda2021]
MRTITLITTLLALSCCDTSCQEIDSLKTLASQTLVKVYSASRNKPMLEKQWQQSLPSHVFDELLSETHAQSMTWLGAQTKKVPVYRPRQRYPKYHSKVCYVSPDDTLVAVPQRYGLIRLYSTDNAQIIGELKGHSKYIGDMCFADNRTLISASGKTIKTWDLQAMRELKSFTSDSSILRMFLSQDNSELYCLLYSGAFETWNLLNDQRSCSVSIPFGADVYALDNIQHRITYKKNKQLMIFDCDYAKVRILDLKDGTYTDISRGIDSIKSFSLLPNHLVCNRNNVLEKINITSAKEDTIFDPSESHKKTILQLKVFKKWLISSSSDRTIKIWDIECGNCLKTLNGHEAPVSALTIKKKQKLLFAGDNYGYIKVWDMEKGNCLHTIDTNESITRTEISRLIFLDNVHLLCESATNTSIWNIAHLPKSYCAFIQKNSHERSIVSESGKVVMIPSKKNFVCIVTKSRSSVNMLSKCPSVLLLFPITCALGVSFMFLYYLA